MLSNCSCIKVSLLMKLLNFLTFMQLLNRGIFNWLFGKKPSSKVIKLNIDGASKGNPGEAGIGGLFRNYNGDFIMGFASYLGTSTSIIAEAKAIYFGLHLAKENNLTNLWIESDSEIMVKILNGAMKPPWGIYYLYKQI